MCRLKAFCCCCSLRSAAITGAVWNALFVLSMLTACVLNLKAYFSKEGFKPPEGVNEDAWIPVSTNTTHYSEEELKTQYLVLGIFGGIRGFFGLLVLVLLCIGIHKGLYNYILPWLVLAIFFIVIGIVSIISLFILGLHWLELVGDLIIYAFWLYVWIAVYSYYKELQEGGPATAYIA